MKKQLWIPQIICIIMLLWALNPDNPYAYYILLRWVCCGVFAYIAFQSFEQKKQGWGWALGITALIYNPFFRVHLNRELWSVINVVTIGMAVVSIFAFKFKKEKNNIISNNDH
jgi:FtsH-binding integral membrane protein